MEGCHSPIQKVPSSKGGTFKHVYEQLGAPCLIYRHAASYTGWDTTPPEPWRVDWHKNREARYIQTAWRSQSRVRSRWFYPVDHQYLPVEEETRDSRKKRKKRRKEQKKKKLQLLKKKKKRREDTDAVNASENDDMAESISGDSSEDEPQSHSKRTGTLVVSSILERSDPLLDADFLRQRMSERMDEATRRGLKKHPQPAIIRQSYQQFDHAYVSGAYRRVERDHTDFHPTLYQHRWKNSFDLSAQRRNADVAYLAPFGFASLNNAVREKVVHRSWQEQKLAIGKQRQASFPIQADGIHSPTRFGNCLLCLPCPCSFCRQCSEGSSWVLIHPGGDMLSCACISNLVLPYGPQNGAATQRGHPTMEIHQDRHEFDVGDRILQIEQCTKESHRDQSLGIFIVRSSCYCTVLRIESRFRQIYRGMSAKHGKAVDEQCLGTYHIEQLARVDLRSFNLAVPSYRPRDIATHPKYDNSQSNGKLAILSHRDEAPANTIHHVFLGREPIVQRHTISCLQNVATLSFTSTNPMTLWAAATSHVRPALVSDIYSKRPALNHGTSLYTVDLRSNDAIFQWSPSAEEFVVEGTHSINSIMTDWRKDHTVWLTSSSAGKTWEIDGRMVGRAVNSWSLPLICDDSDALLPAMGLHGAGSLLVDPLVDDIEVTTSDWRPILSVDRTPGSFGLHLYQRPENRPRFQTNSLECVSGAWNEVGRRRASIISSSVFALPDVSPRVFTCGIAAFHAPLSHILRCGNSSEAKGPVDKCLGVVTMTNKGDLYTHVLSIGRSGGATTKSEMYPGLPAGATAIPPTRQDPPKSLEDDPFRFSSMRKLDGGWNLPIAVSNQYPLASESISNAFIRSRAGCRPFESVDLDRLAKAPPQREDKKPHQNDRRDLSAVENDLREEHAEAVTKTLTEFHESFTNRQMSRFNNDATLREEAPSDLNARVLGSMASLWEEDLI